MHFQKMYTCLWFKWNASKKKIPKVNILRFSPVSTVCVVPFAVGKHIIKHSIAKTILS